MTPWWLPAALLVVVWLSEAWSWRGRAKTEPPSEHDRGTVWVNRVVGGGGIAAAFALLPVTRERADLALPAALAWGGIGVAACGMAIRAWAMGTLGRYFTATLQLQRDQPIIDRGPYRWIRHPSYLGGDLALVGVGLTCGTLPSALLMAVPFIAAHVWRIPIEERMLAQTRGDQWPPYRARTWRMLPYVW
jgi:protein-S-isoprenylcysteine O-methyltransferase Ste14